MSERRLNSVDEKMYAIFVSGSNAPPSQFVPPLLPGIMSMPNLPSWPRSIGGSNRLSLYLCRLSTRSASALISGVQSLTSLSRMPCMSYAAGLVGYGCVGEYHSVGTLPRGTGRSSIGHTGCPVTRSNV